MEGFKELLSLISGFLTPIIAIITTYIVIQQYITAKAKLRLDLYDKRFKVYFSLKQFISSIVCNANVTEQELHKFLVDTNESIFLFNDDVNEYLNLVYKKGCDKWLCYKRLDDEKLPIGEERNKIAQSDYELNIWFAEQLKTSNQKFMKYLYFKIK